MSAATNNTVVGSDFTIPDSEAVAFDATEFLIEALHGLDIHTHRVGLGAAVGRVDTATVPSVAGEVRVNGDDFQWFGTALQTALRLDGTQTVIGVKTFTLAPVFSVGFVANASSYLNDTTNVSMTLGLTLNQGAADDEILAFKSSDVAHGVTSYAETDTYGHFQKVSPTAGGLYVWGFSEANIGVSLVGVSTTEDTTHATTSIGNVMVEAALKSGTATGVHGANGNLFVVRENFTTAKFIVDKEGDISVDGSTTITTYDAYDDLSLVRAFDLAHGRGVIDGAWDRFVTHNRSDLEELGILGRPGPDGGRGLVNVTRLQRLHNGALWQLNTKINRLAARLGLSETEILALGDA